MNCTSCGRDARPGDSFCASCGHELSPPACPRCGAVSRPDARFCVECGAELAGAAGVPSGAALIGEPAPGPEVLPDERVVFEEDPGPPRWEARLAPATGLPAREAPDQNARVVTDLAPGSQLLVLERSERWARVTAESGSGGWVEAGLLVDPDLPAAPDQGGSRR